ncbi:hypothetical protein B0T19DRAFT_410536 [Cercophora scortea]|uniref:Uncharacterized protein n=1 Tax=Cercophora scortea TaxID=314031 RepID=A0AAE0J597_9PEZI|nr:hypothetical protein B0T19DRAFT_410536 [Cercophora scortea]
MTLFVIRSTHCQPENTTNRSIDENGSRDEDELSLTKLLRRRSQTQCPSSRDLMCARQLFLRQRLKSQDQNILECCTPNPNPDLETSNTYSLLGILSSTFFEFFPVRIIARKAVAPSSNARVLDRSIASRKSILVTHLQVQGKVPFALQGAGPGCRISSSIPNPSCPRTPPSSPSTIDNGSRLHPHRSPLKTPSKRRNQPLNRTRMAGSVRGRGRDKDGGDHGYDDNVEFDKNWPTKYILDPLNEPEPNQVCATRIKIPTPPISPVPSRTSSTFRRRPDSTLPDAKEPEEPRPPFLRRLLSRRSNLNKGAINPPTPPDTSYPPITARGRKKSFVTPRPPSAQWNQGTILSRPTSVVSLRHIHRHQPPSSRDGSFAERSPGERSPPRTLEMFAQDAKEGRSLRRRRSSSLQERFPGDMSHRPLAILTREHKAADRSPHLHNPRRRQPSDTIDSLDHSGPASVTYHHGGPFDPTMETYNKNKKYSPLEAVKDTNMEALRATPAEYVQDSLVKHVPLQGTAVVPPGCQDMSGRTMNYEEGADIMRDRDAGGGAYRRYDHIPYLDEDYKGKGEPSFTIEKAQKEQKARLKHHSAIGNEDGNHSSSTTTSGIAFEMQPQKVPARSNSTQGKGNRVRARHTSLGNAPEAGPSLSSRGPRPVSTGDDPFSDEYATGHHRGVQSSSSNTTKRSVIQTLRRKFGGLGRKKGGDEGNY